jgi:3-(3-hydroxy-phenyl)propionate hydroxylase
LPDSFPAGGLPPRVSVLIAGGGPVGLTLAALLARQGVDSLVVEADAGYCTGSRAICISRRSQEILAAAGAGAALAAKALPWTGGRSYWRDTEVLHFRMPSEPSQRFAPMVNIQQYYVEQFVHEALLAEPRHGTVAWGSRVAGVKPAPDHVAVEVETAAGVQTVQADFVVACDGGRSTVRERLGLQLEGTQYEGRYVIVDIVQKTRRPVERLRGDEDGEQALRPESILPRVQSHLTMIGEHEPWSMLWASMYNAKCLSLGSYRHGRVLFAGDAAHLVPIFGVRGLNSGLDDAANLAWKLARVLDGAPAGLLDSYSDERVHATRENLAYGAKSTEFMAPPDFAFRLMREATLRLAAGDERVRPLINPRQSAPVAYPASALNGPSVGDWANDLAAPGRPAPEALLKGAHGELHLTQVLGHEFVCLVFGDEPLPQAVAALTQHGVAVLEIPADADVLGQARERYGLPSPEATGLVLLRPDGYIMGRWRGLDAAAVLACLAKKGLS